MTHPLGLDPFRPRDEFDVDVHPESLRGKALQLMDDVDEAWGRVAAAIAALPWYRRLPTRALMAAVLALRRLRRLRHG